MWAVPQRLPLTVDDATSLHGVQVAEVTTLLLEGRAGPPRSGASLAFLESRGYLNRGGYSTCVPEQRSVPLPWAFTLNDVSVVTIPG